MIVSSIVFDQVRKRYAGGAPVIDRMDLAVHDGELLVCWWARQDAAKSTVLRMVAGLEPVSGGEIRIGGRVGERSAAAAAQCGDGVPELCPLPAHDGAPQPGIPP